VCECMGHGKRTYTSISSSVSFRKTLLGRMRSTNMFFCHPNSHAGRSDVSVVNPLTTFTHT